MIALSPRISRACSPSCHAVPMDTVAPSTLAASTSSSMMQESRHCGTDSKSDTPADHRFVVQFFSDLQHGDAAVDRLLHLGRQICSRAVMAYSE
ncbi:MAG: hypothetical protein ACLR5S_04075 [Ruminococcus sp.]